MGDFKKGDKVECLKSDLGRRKFTKGKVYVVSKVGGVVVWVEKADDGYEDGFHKDNFKLVVKEHNHYFIDVGEFYDSDTGKCEIDVYVILEKFGITNPCLQHIAKKALVTGKRGHKNYERDLQDIIDTAEREKVIHSNRK